MIDFGVQYQMVFEVWFVYDLVCEYGFVGVVVDMINFEGLIWIWWCEGGKFYVKKIVMILVELVVVDELLLLL